MKLQHEVKFPVPQLAQNISFLGFLLSAVSVCGYTYGMVWVQVKVRAKVAVTCTVLGSD